MIARAGFLLLAVVLFSFSSYASVPVDASSATVPVTIELKHAHGYEPHWFFDIFVFDLTTGEDIICEYDAQIGDSFTLDTASGHEYELEVAVFTSGRPGGNFGPFIEEFYFSNPSGGSISVVAQNVEPYGRIESHLY